jgi:hypothetical protein
VTHRARLHVSWSPSTRASANKPREARRRAGQSFPSILCLTHSPCASVWSSRACHARAARASSSSGAFAARPARPPAHRGVRWSVPSRSKEVVPSWATETSRIGILGLTKRRWKRSASCSRDIGGLLATAWSPNTTSRPSRAPQTRRTCPRWLAAERGGREAASRRRRRLDQSAPDLAPGSTISTPLPLRVGLGPPDPRDERRGNRQVLS